ncbi:S-layer homology domain-containing protein [Funiculus sociatus GB2-A5]|uniref:S-layer homology domain-containing protein n=1 Tax=Funiculus sociatus GB2-A5 TaxID=2933946 RepID=A0ABV0JQ11_9CYAN|nr:MULTISPECIES: S-layer homology domain-containing protein [unclassified Trichocoleus]MBD1908044.1 S-layer homology domain-containing protein [Trichocoleus sp. FACHB-832]MBD2061600.1 S-layer homology domain-containing protein [Trichocoleus sp. FACHB-6]
MLKTSLIATSLLLAATVSYPLKTLAQVPSTQNDANSQRGCLSGYPDGTYRGQRSVSRYEFAAALNACLNQLNQLIPSDRADLATREEVETLIQRQRQLNEQLRELSDRVGTLSGESSDTTGK